jgi:uncharacterized protein (TIGR03437 family)
VDPTTPTINTAARITIGIDPSRLPAGQTDVRARVRVRSGGGYQGENNIFITTNVTLPAATVAVPNVVGLAQAAASTAIQNASLALGTVTNQASATIPSGSVISQNPAAGTQVAAGSTVALVVSTGPPQVTVPNVAGMTQTAAATAIQAAGLVVGTVTMQSSTTVAAGRVISQNPGAGTQLSQGASVSLVVSSGPPTTVPNVVGLAQAAATMAIQNSGLALGTVTNQASATIPSGSVISQNPTAGTQVAAGSTVALVVSTGPPQVTVPNVAGMTQAVAATAIQAAGLAVGSVTMQSSTTVAAGRVISQNPAAGAQVAQGASVSLVVSSGPPTTVPNVVGLAQAAATMAIQNAGLALGTVTNQASATISSGSVISQNPTAGTQVAAGSTVTLVVSTGPPQVTVPNVVGMTQAAVVAAVQSAGLVLGQITTQASATVAIGLVMNQNPQAGAQVAQGSAVAVVISSGPPQVNVPNVAGFTQTAAATALQTAGLVLGSVTTQASGTVPAGNVISQNPAAGAQAPQGSAVTLVLSSGVSQVTAPNVVGLTQSAAVTAIQNAGFTVGSVTTQASATVPAGSVISQNPGAGAQISTGSAISLVVSSGPDSGAPAIRPNAGVVTATAYGGSNAVAPGSWMEIYGSNLASNTRQWAGPDFRGNAAPTTLDGTTVTINGQPAFVFYISPGQVNAQVPSTVAPGPAQVVVTNGSRSTPAATVQVNAIEPGVLALTAGATQYAVGILPDLTYALPPGAVSGVGGRQAKPGETIVFYGVGFGPVKTLTGGISLAAGEVVTQANRIDAPLTITFGGTPATVTYAGLATTFVGLYQFNVVVPAVPDSDTVPVTFSLNGTPIRQTLYTAVQR